jgi:hypothetical protein
VNELQYGKLFKFSDWPTDEVPRRAAGVYTVWREDEFIYVGMSGRGAHREDFVADADARAKPLGLWTRLNSHASGRRSGDQFNVYICDRFIVPNIESQEQQLIGRGKLMLDQMTRAFIREHLGFRFVVCQDGGQALALEGQVRGGSLPAGRSYLNPL